MNKKHLQSFNLKYNPFGLNPPTDGLLVTSQMENFFWRISQGLLREGGFALITGEPGSGKSVALQLLIEYLNRQEEVIVGILSRPQSRLCDFYREMGELFGIDIKPHNRWGGFKTLRKTWQEHLDKRLIRPILLIDEAQQMNPEVLSELRVLASTQLDSRSILSVVLAGDLRLIELLRRPELVPLAGRIRHRIALEPSNRDELREYLCHLQTQAGNAKLLTPELVNTLADHAQGNLRLMINLANELFTTAIQKNVSTLDEKLFLEMCEFARKPRILPPRGEEGARRVSKQN
jgi:type II secretory pathway predicted ATPase ExeA